MIHNSEEIHAAIIGQIQLAATSIKVASAWFTDPEIFQALVLKQENGVSVSVIIADNESNEKLDFTPLISAGGKLLRIKKTGFGMMHQKFLIFDDNTVISGSYNLTVNARLNNHEQIILSTDKSLIDQFTNLFKQMENQENIAVPQIENGITNLTPPVTRWGNAKVEKKTEDQQFEESLNAIISAELDLFNVEDLVLEGRRNARELNGEAAFLNARLDDFYCRIREQIRRADIDIANMEKRLNEQLILATQRINEEFSAHTEQYNSQYQIAVDTIKKEKQESEKNIIEFEHIVEEVTANKIAELQKELDSLNKEKFELKESNVKNPKDNFSLISAGIFGSILTSFAFMFYSSAGYILFFSSQVYKEAYANGILLPDPGIYNPDALSLSLEKGFSALLIVCLFGLVPVAIAASKVFKINRVVALIFAILFDGFIAFKIAATVHTSNQLINGGNDPYPLKDLFYDSNFLLVLVLGAGILFVIHMIINNLYNFYQSHYLNKFNTDNQRRLDLIKARIEELKVKIIEVKQESINAKLEIERNKTLISQFNSEISNKKSQLIEKLASLDADKQQKIGFYTSLVQTKISMLKSRNIPISHSTIRNRIAHYMEGWFGFLHAEFSTARANEMTNKANHIIESWFTSNSMEQIKAA